MEEDELRTISEEDLLVKVKMESKHPELVDSIWNVGQLSFMSLRDAQLKKIKKSN